MKRALSLLLLMTMVVTSVFVAIPVGAASTTDYIYYQDFQNEAEGSRPNGRGLFSDEVNTTYGLTTIGFFSTFTAEWTHGVAKEGDNLFYRWNLNDAEVPNGGANAVFWFGKDYPDTVQKVKFSTKLRFHKGRQHFSFAYGTSQGEKVERITIDQNTIDVLIDDAGVFTPLNAGWTIDLGEWYTLTTEIDYANEKITYQWIPEGGTAQTCISSFTPDASYTLNYFRTDGAGETMKINYDLDDMIVTLTQESDVAPKVKGASVTGTAAPYETLYGSYSYDPGKGALMQPTDASTYIWMSSVTENGGYAIIPGSISKNYTLTTAEEGKWVKFCVSNGESYAESTPIFVKSTAPSVSGARIIGSPKVGQTLTGGYVFDAGTGSLKNENDESTYQWLIADSKNSTYTAINGADDLTYVPGELDAERFIKFRVENGDSFDESDPVQIFPAVVALGENSLFVSLDGNDSTGNGTEDAPFRTLEKARDTIRAMAELPEGGINVYLRGGVYTLSNSFSLTSADSGEAGKPITYQAYPGEEVSISGMKALDYSLFQPVTGAMKDLLHSTDAQNNVLVADMADLGLNANMSVCQTAGRVRGEPMFLLDGQTMRLSRYPDATVTGDWAKARVLNAGGTESSLGVGAKFSYDDAVIDNLTYQTNQFCYMGFWNYAWYCEIVTGNLDVANHTVTRNQPGRMAYGMGGDSQPFIIYNTYEEISEPGEWYIDKSEGKMYLYPFPGTNAQSDFYYVSHAGFTLVKVEGASHVNFRNLNILGSESELVNVKNANGIVFDNCELSDSRSMAQAVTFQNCKNSGLLSSSIHNVAAEGVEFLNCGNRATMESSGCFVTSCTVSDFATDTGAQHVGIRAEDCVGVTINHNDIGYGPDAAIAYQGVYIIIEYNKIHDVVQYTGDAGAIYAGRHLNDHGNEIRYNHFYNIGQFSGSFKYGASAVFFDDGMWGQSLTNNVFGPNISQYAAIKIHGGQNNIVQGNVFVDAPWCFAQMGWNNQAYQDIFNGTGAYSYTAQYKDLINSVNQNPLYVERWPWLAETVPGVFEDFDIFNYPNSFGKNIVLYFEKEPPAYNTYHPGPGWWQGGRNSVAIADTSTNIVKFKNQTDPAWIVNDDLAEFELAPEVYELLPDFEAIPMTEIGPYSFDKSDLRIEVREATDILDGVTAGTGLGQVPASVLEELTNAVADAQALLGNPIAGTGEMISVMQALKEANAALANSIVTEATVNGGTVEIPAYLPEVTLHIAGATDVQVPTDVALPEITIDGNVTIAGVSRNVTVTIPAGTVVTGTDPIMSLFETKTEPSGEVEGENITVLQLANSETLTFSQPIRISLPGTKNQKIAMFEDGTAIEGVTRLLSADTLEAATVALTNATPWAIFNATTGKVLWTTVLNEIVAYSEATGEEGSGDTGISPSPSLPGSTPGSTSPGGSIAGGGMITPTPSLTFNDIAGHWAEQDIKDMVAKNVVSGVTNTTFEPDRNITRAEMATLIAKALKLTSKNAAKFDDVNAGDWFYATVNAAANAGIIQGYDGKFRPNDTVTREEMAVMIAKAYQFAGGTLESGNVSNFTDGKQISTWAASYVGSVTKAGLISGMADGRFAPQENATRAQATSLIKRLLAKI